MSTPKPQTPKEIGEKFEQLVAIMARLRGRNGCPWDRKQTHESLRQYLLEEAHEVLESIDENNLGGLKEELGDLLLQIVFHAQIAAEEQAFAIGDVLDVITEKLIRRHPNVFGDVEIHTAEEQSINWERIKKNEGKASVLDGVPRTLPALARASRLQQKAATVGFDWPDAAPVWDKIDEELRELRAACERKDEAHMEEEFGDLLFSMVNLSRFLGIHPEDALRKTSEKFTRRFQRIEEQLEDSNKEIKEATLDELDALWEKAKEQERKRNPQIK